MHPVIRILCFLIFSGFVAFGNLSTLLFASLIFAVALAKPELVNFSAYLQQLRRLKWFFFSILLLYVWFTPGNAILPNFPVLSPSSEGIQLGSERVIALMYIVFALHILIKTIASDRLIEAILWCLQPLKWLGLPHQSLAIRISLTLKILDQVQVFCSRPSPEADRQHPPIGFFQRMLQKIDGVAERVTEIFANVIQSAENMPTQAVAIDMGGSLPPISQWLYPMILLFAFVYL